MVGQELAFIEAQRCPAWVTSPCFHSGMRRDVFRFPYPSALLSNIPLTFTSMSETGCRIGKPCIASFASISKCAVDGRVRSLLENRLAIATGWQKVFE
jgi:hypothetical protein